MFDSGLGGTSLDWARVHPQIAEETRACVYDRAGYGWSDRGPSPRSSQFIAGELQALLGYGSIAGPYLLVGHSFGGFNVRMFASRHPERVAGMVLVDASHEDQFDNFDSAGLTPADPGGRNFFVRNQFEIPAGLPAILKPMAQTFANSSDSITALYGELANLRTSARQVSRAAPLPDVPLVVVHHDPSDDISADPRKAQKARLWQSMQSDLGTLTQQSHTIIAQTHDHHIHLSEPETVISAIRKVLATVRANAHD